MPTKLAMPKPLAQIDNPNKMPKLGVPKAPAPTTSVKSPMKIGSTAVKMPKTKALAQPGDKPSLFFKNEESLRVKGVKALENFLMSIKNKK